MAATAADTSSAPAAAESSGELQRRALAVLGGVVADAAATSTHWVYDVVSSARSSANVLASRNSLRQLVQDRIAEVAKAHNGGDVAFVPPSKTGAYHDGVPAYFAHKSKVHGDHTYYSEIGLALARSLVEKGALDIQDFQQKILDAFGFGGSYSGYMPGVLRHVLPSLQAGVESAGPLSGTMDDGHSDSTINGALVVLAARFAGSEGYQDKVQTVVRALCNTERALSSAKAVASALEAVIQGKPLNAALDAAFPSDAAGVEAVKLAADALSAAATGAEKSGDFKAVAKKFGPACDVKHSLPLAVFSAKYTAAGGDAVPDFKTAVRTNTALSGDTCGRAPVVGALVAAAETPGASVEWADWLAQLSAGAEVAKLASALSSAAHETAA